MIRTLPVMAVVFLTVSFARAQAPPAPPPPPRDATAGRRGEVMTERNRVKLGNTSTQGPNQTRNPDTFEASLVVKNHGTKTIRSVSWAVTVVDKESGDIVRKYNVTTEKLIPPGKRTKLTRRFVLPSVRVVSAEQSAKKSPATDILTTVTRIEYTDGSVSDTP